ncbi:MAG: aspartate aminotransferase family protein [Chloroflexi bacterium]|nr:aspartate aminotransferase family protein [Chloroflexota bacterium]
MNPNEIPDAESVYLIPTYRRPRVVFSHGEGAYLFDSNGKRYLDFAAGIAVTALGHGFPAWVEAVVDQASRLTHISNLFHSAPQIELAKRLVENSFADRVFFSNSGSEANEAALKFARKWARTNHGEDKTDFIAFEGGFHGRTLGALSLTHKNKYREPFGPLVPGVTFVPFNDLDAARRAITDRTCAVFVEPVQGEGGVRIADVLFLQGLREICDQHATLLVCDEIQCGLGRTGRLWAHDVYGITPDIMTLAKPLAGGLPIGVTLVTEEVSRAVEVGDHGSTFGGGPLTCRAAQIIFDYINQPDLLEGVVRSGEALMKGLREFSSDNIIDVRGAGLLVGVELKTAVKPLIEHSLEQGLIVISAGENVLRLCPPLTITIDEVNTALEILNKGISALERTS